MTKRSEKIAGHLDLDEIKKLMKKYKESHDLYEKLLLISMVYQGESIAKASKYLNKSRKNWGTMGEKLQ